MKLSIQIAIFAIMFNIMSFTNIPAHTSQIIDNRKAPAITPQIYGFSISDIIAGTSDTIQKLQKLGLSREKIQQIRKDLSHQFSGKAKGLSYPGIVNRGNSFVPCGCALGQVAYATFTAGYGSVYGEFNHLNGGFGLGATCTDTILGCWYIQNYDPAPTNRTLSHSVTTSNWVSLHTAWCG